MRRALSLLSTALFTIGVIAACGGDPERPKHSPSEQPPQPISNTSGGSGGEGGAADASTEAATDSATPTSCNDVTLGGADVPETGVAGDPAAGTGGTLVEGTYDLIEAQKFVGTGTPGATGKTFKSTVRLSGQTIDRMIRENNSDRRQRGTYASSGPSLTYAISCPVTAQEQLTYSVNGNNVTLTDVIARTSWTYVKK